MSVEEKLQNKDKGAESFENNININGVVMDVCEKNLETKCNNDKSGTTSDEVVHSSFKVDEEKKSKSNQNNCYTYLKQTAILWWTERVILISVCIAIAVGFTIPIIIYAIDTDRGDNSTLSIDIDVDSCQTLSSMSSHTQVCLCRHTYKARGLQLPKNPVQDLQSSPDCKIVIKDCNLA